MCAASAVAALILSGCVVSPIYYQYPDQSKSMEDEAILFIAAKDDIFFKDLDGKELANPYTTLNGGYSAVREIHLLPGIHTVLGRATKAGVYTWYNVSYDFSAGKKYRLTATLNGYRLDAAVVETNN